MTTEASLDNNQRTLSAESYSARAVRAEMIAIGAGRGLIRCAADPALQGGVNSADGKAVLVWGFSAVTVVSRCTGE
jgi:hypothetical protein